PAIADRERTLANQGLLRLPRHARRIERLQHKKGIARVQEPLDARTWAPTSNQPGPAQPALVRRSYEKRVDSCLIPVLGSAGLRLIIVDIVMHRGKRSHMRVHDPGL